MKKGKSKQKDSKEEVADNRIINEKETRTIPLGVL